MKNNDIIDERGFKNARILNDLLCILGFISMFLQTLLDLQELILSIPKLPDLGSKHTALFMFGYYHNTILSSFSNFFTSIQKSS